VEAARRNASVAIVFFMVFTPLYEGILKRILVEKSVDFMQQLPIDRPKIPLKLRCGFRAQRNSRGSSSWRQGIGVVSTPCLAPRLVYPEIKYVLILATAYQWRDYLFRPAFLGAQISLIVSLL
jgi:hypothetical protein